MVRTWTVLTPIALAQGRTDALVRAKAWLDPKRGSFPDSPFGRFMHAAMDLRFVAAGLLSAFEPGADLLDIWNEAPGMASFFAAMETVLGAWMRDRRLDLVDAAVERMEAWNGSEGWMTPHRAGSESLVRGRLALVREDHAAAADLARSSLAAFDQLPAPWGEAKALRLLEQAGAASSDDLERAAAIERGLGIGSATS